MNKGLLLFLTFWISLLSAEEMVTVPAGSFIMGGNSGESDEKPAHEVFLPAFKIDKHEVSRKEYEECVKSGRCKPAHYSDGKCHMWTSKGPKKVRVPSKYQSPNYPVVCVSWYQARDYCRTKGKRLPTEAEWEKAALAGTKNKYAWGDSNPSSSQCATPSSGAPSSVGSFSANKYQIKDMTGNVWEWVNDRYERDYYHHSDKTSPKGPPVGRFRVIRGGGWYSGVKQLRIKNRQWFVGEGGEVSVGFRCAK